MPSPSNTEFDSNTPDASATSSTSGKTHSSIGQDPNNPRPEVSSTSGQPTMRPPPCSIEYDPNNPPSEISSTAGQPTMRPPLSSIEYDPNNPLPETPSSQNQPVTVKNKLTRFERFTIQLPVWKQHLHDFCVEVCAATVLAMTAVVVTIFAYITEEKFVFLLITFLLCFMCFSLIWLWISGEPPFLSDDKGNAIKPAYLLPQKLSNSSYDLLSDSQRRELRVEQEYLESLQEIQNS